MRLFGTIFKGYSKPRDRQGTRVFRQDPRAARGAMKPTVLLSMTVGVIAILLAARYGHLFDDVSREQFWVGVVLGCVVSWIVLWILGG